MASAELITKFIQINFDTVQGQVNANVLGSLSLTSNFETVKEAVSSLATVASNVGMKEVLKIGAAATAVTVAAAVTHQLYKWIVVKDIKANNVLELQMPKKREQLFDKELEKSIMIQLQNWFEDMHLHVEDIIGEDSDNGSKIVEMLKDVRVSSVRACESGTGSRVIGQHIKGENFKQTQENQISLTVATNGKGATGLLVEGGNATISQKGGASLTGDVGPEHIAAVESLLKAKGSDMITVNVVGDDIEEEFKEQYRESDLINNILLALKKREKKDFTLWKKDSKEPLDRTLSLSDAGVKHKSVLTAVRIAAKE